MTQTYQETFLSQQAQEYNLSQDAVLEAWNSSTDWDGFLFKIRKTTTRWDD
jgi:hypothetical protein